MKKTYHIVNREEKTAAASIEQFAKSNGQLLLPLIELITEVRAATLRQGEQGSELLADR